MAADGQPAPEGAKATGGGAGDSQACRSVGDDIDLRYRMLLAAPLLKAKRAAPEGAKKTEGKAGGPQARSFFSPVGDDISMSTILGTLPWKTVQRDASAGRTTGEVGAAGAGVAAKAAATGAAAAATGAGTLEAGMTQAGANNAPPSAAPSPACKAAEAEAPAAPGARPHAGAGDGDQRPGGKRAAAAAGLAAPGCEPAAKAHKAGRVGVVDAADQVAHEARDVGEDARQDRGGDVPTGSMDGQHEGIEGEEGNGGRRSLGEVGEGAPPVVTKGRQPGVGASALPTQQRQPEGPQPPELRAAPVQVPAGAGPGAGAPLKGQGTKSGTASHNPTSKERKVGDI